MLPYNRNTHGPQARYHTMPKLATGCLSSSSLCYYAFSADFYAHSALPRSLCLIPPCPQVIAGLDATLQAQLARLADVWWGRPLFKSGVANEARR